MQDERQKTEGDQSSQAVAAEGNHAEFLERPPICEAKENDGGVQDEQERRQSFLKAVGHTRLSNAAPHLPPLRRRVGRKQDVQISPDRGAESADGG